MEEKAYNFKFQNIKALRFIALAFLGLPLLFLLGPNHLNVWLFMFVLFGPVVLAMTALFIKMKAEDVIFVKDTYFNSSYFGRISYKDIRSISSPIFYGEPCLRLKLGNGTKVTWLLNSGHGSAVGKEDISVFLEFTKALERKIKDLKDISLAEQLDEVKKKNNIAKWVVPVGLLFAVVALVRSYSDDWFRQKSPIGREATKKLGEEYLRLSNDAKLVLEKIIQKSGPYFLYSNDTAASVALIPDLDPGSPTDVTALKYLAANKSLKAFIDDPDSVKLDMYIVDSGNHFKKLSKSLLNSNDSTKTYFYFRANDPTIQNSSTPLKATDLKRKDVARPFDVTTGIPFYNTLSLAQTISETFPGMSMMLANARLRPSSFKLYLAARTGAGINEAVFRKAVSELNKQMNAVNVDTATFKLKVFYKNIYRDEVL